MTELLPNQIGMYGTPSFTNYPNLMDDDFSSHIGNIFNNYLGGYTGTANAASIAAQREKRLEELDKKAEKSKDVLKKSEEALEQKEEAQSDKVDSGKKFGFGDALKSIGKGVAGFVTNMFMTKDENGKTQFSMGKTVFSLGVAGAAIAATFLCPPLGVALAVAGAGMSGVQVVKGISDASNATTYADKDAAVQEMSEGLIGGALSVLGFKASAGIKAAKSTKTAETLVGATTKLELAARESSRNSRVLSIIKDDAKLAENAEAVSLIKNALKNGEPENFPSLLIKANVDNEKIIALTSELRYNPGPSTKDSRLLYAIEDQIDIIRNAGRNSKETENAVKTVSELLKVTQKDGISAEVEAAIQQMQKDTPALAKLLKSVSNSTTKATKTVSNIANRENSINSELNIIRNGKAFAKPEDEALVNEAIALLDKVKEGNVKSKELGGMFERLLSSDSIDTILKAKIEGAYRALDITESAGMAVVDKLASVPGKVLKATGKIITHPFTQPKDFALQVARTDLFLSQTLNMTDESARQIQQAQTIGKLDKEVKTQKNDVTAKQNNYRKSLEDIARMYKIEAKDKSNTELLDEITEAKDTEAKAKAEKTAKAAG